MPDRFVDLKRELGAFEDDVEFSGGTLIGRQERDLADLLEVHPDRVVDADHVGGEGLELLRTLVPDIIVTDLRMSPVNGFDFYRAIKQRPALRSTPVVFFTALDDFLARQYSDLLGVDAYVTKPVDMERLDEALRQHLDLPKPS